MREASGAEFYARLKAAARAAAGAPLAVFASAADVDGLCALRTLRHMLVCDSVRHSVFPVTAAADVARAVKAVSAAGDALAVLLVNWGAASDVRRLLRLGSHVRVFILDSHRPVHLTNWSALNTQVTVLYTATEEADAGRLTGVDDLADAALTAAGAPSESESESDMESESESEDEAEDGRERRKRRRKDRQEEEAVAAFRRRKRGYYGGGGGAGWYGRSAAWQAFDMAHALHMNSNEALWCAIVGVTDQLLHGRVSAERYASGAMALENAVNVSGNLEAGSGSGVVKLSDGTAVRAPDAERIGYGEEPRLVLLRHWSLLDSMRCSPYTAAVLKTWAPPGDRRLRLLLASCGIPLADCRQPYAAMRAEPKRRLRAEMERFAPRFGLHRLYSRTFFRSHGYCSHVTAADAVYAAAALLDCAAGSGGAATDHRGSVGAATNHSGAGSPGDAVQGAGVWEAYRSLGAANTALLQEGVRLAVRQQAALYGAAAAALSRPGAIRTARAFRWLVIPDNPDAALLAHPAPLARLARFLLDALRQLGARRKPLLCAAVHAGAAVIASAESGDADAFGGDPGDGDTWRPPRGRRRLPAALRRAARSFGVDAREEPFDACTWLRLDEASVCAFMAHLSDIL